MSRVFGLTLLVGLAAGARAGQPWDAVLLLEVREEARPGFVPEAAPVRFGLWDRGQIVVGGTSELMGGKLEKAERKALQRRIREVLHPGLPAQVEFTAGPPRYRLLLQQTGREYLISGDLAGAAPELRPLAQLLADLSTFRHASLRPVAPGGLWVGAVEQTLPGECRPWTLHVPLSTVTAKNTMVLVGVRDAAGWPLGATAASVCEGGRQYAVTFRPMALSPMSAEFQAAHRVTPGSPLHFNIPTESQSCCAWPPSGDHNNDYAYEGSPLQ